MIVKKALSALNTPHEPLKPFETLITEPTSAAGWIYGRARQLHPPKTPPHTVRAFQPADAPSIDRQDIAFWVNGISRLPEAAAAVAQALANKTGRPIIGINHVHDGLVSSIAQSLWALTRPDHSPTARTIALLMQSAVSAGRDIMFYAEGHGGAVLAQATEIVFARLLHAELRTGVGEYAAVRAVRKKMRHVHTVTFGSLGRGFSIRLGSVTHYVNRNDPLPNDFGVVAPGQVCDPAVLVNVCFGPAWVTAFCPVERLNEVHAGEHYIRALP